MRESSLFGAKVREERELLQLLALEGWVMIAPEPERLSEEEEQSYRNGRWLGEEQQHGS